MSSRDDHKVEQILSNSQAAELLRDLADQMAGGTLEAGGVRLDLGEGPLRLELSAQAGPKGQYLKLKLRFNAGPRPAQEDQGAAPGPEPSPAARPGPGPRAPDPPRAIPVTHGNLAFEFKELKVNLGRCFKEVKAALGQGAPPAPAICRELARLCQAAANQPGLTGDPAWGQLARLALVLAKAAQAGDPAAAALAAGAMDRLKKDCHGRR